MRRSVPHSIYPRAVVLMLALLSSVLLGGAQSVSCEMHGLGAARGMLMDAAAMTDHAGMAVMSHDGSHTAGGDADSHCCCTCIGDCTMLAPLATAPTATTIRVALATPEPRRPIASERTRAPPAEPDRLLPFAIGPPA